MMNPAPEEDVRKLGSLLSTMVRSFFSLEKNEVCCCGVTMSQCSTIMALGNNGRMTMNRLSESLSVATSNLTRIVDNLVRDGLVERIRDDQDRRLVYVGLTREGKDIFEQINQITHRYYRGIMDNIPPEERGNVLAAIEVLEEAIEKTPAILQECGCPGQ